MKTLTNKWTCLFTSNFLSVYNDNLLKNSIIFVGITWAIPQWLTQSQLVSVVSACLIIPYLFLSPLAGSLAVKYSKLQIFRICKLLEIPIMVLACVAFYYNWILVAVLSVLLMGILSCLYSPAKYSLIRDIGGENGLSKATGIFETMAFLGILIGTVTAAVLSDLKQPILIYVFYIGLALLGYYMTYHIKAQELPANKNESMQLNPVSYLWHSYQFARNHKWVNTAVFGASIFWLIGGMLQMNLIIHCKHVYQTSNSVTGIVMAFAAIGIALGCTIAGKVSGKAARKGLILIGLAGMILILILLTFFKLPFSVFALLIFSFAFSGGFFQVPCLALLQHANIGRKLGDMIAYLNLVTFIFVLLGTFLFSGITFLCNENSFIVFGAILVICIITVGYFLKKSSVFLSEACQILFPSKSKE